MSAAVKKNHHPSLTTAREAKLKEYLIIVCSEYSRAEGRPELRSLSYLLATAAAIVQTEPREKALALIHEGLCGLVGEDYDRWLARSVEAHVKSGAVVNMDTVRRVKRKRAIIEAGEATAPKVRV